MKQVINIMKQKSSQEIKRVASHNLRQVPSRNVAKNKTKLNHYFIGNPKTDVLAEIDRRCEDIPKFRKDAVKTINLVLSASPDFFDSGKIREWEETSQLWAEKTFGKENIVYSVVHYDEKTPHFHICLVPIYQGKLRASHWLDGPAKINKLHDSYASDLKHLGISRGNKQVKASSEETQAFYNKVNASTKYERQLDKKLDDLFNQFENPTFIQKINPWGRIEEVIKPLMTQLTKNLSHYRTKAKYNEEVKKELEQAKQDIADMQLKFETLGIKPNISFIECENLSHTVKTAMQRATVSTDAFAPATKPDHYFEPPATPLRKNSGLKIH